MLACESHLIPLEMDWIQWSQFIACFRSIDDFSVAKRYHYGRLHLSRLNWVTRFYRPRTAHTIWFYELPHWSIISYVQMAIAPIIFAFGSLSIVLSSMQVLASLPPDVFELRQSHLQAMQRTFFASSIYLKWEQHQM